MSSAAQVWGKPRDFGSDLEAESSDSDAESEMSDFMDQTAGGVGDVLLDEDAKVEVFLSEVTESLVRGIGEGVDANNLILEINSSRHAYAVTATQVIQYVLTAVINISMDSVEGTEMK